MKVFLIILFVILMIASLAVAIGFGILYTGKYNKTSDTKSEKRYKRNRAITVLTGGISFVILLFSMIVWPCQLYEVKSGEVAVVKSYGEVVRIELPGLRFKNAFSEKYEIYSIQVQEIQVEKECYSKDLQAVKVKQIIQFRIQPENVKDICIKYGSLEILKTRIATLSYEAIEESAKSFDAKELVTKRGEFNQAIKDNIGGKYESYYIDIHQTILSDIMFTAEFEELIQKAKLAEQEIERAKQELEKQLQEATYKVKLAEQEALERLAKAQGEADAKLAMAEAEAKAVEAMAMAEAEKIKAIAEAEAEAIKIKLAELSAADPSSVAYLEYLAWVEAWDGKLPQTILGDNVDILFPHP